MVSSTTSAVSVVLKLKVPDEPRSTLVPTKRAPEIPAGSNCPDTKASTPRPPEGSPLERIICALPTILLKGTTVPFMVQEPSPPLGNGRVISSELILFWPIPARTILPRLEPSRREVAGLKVRWYATEMEKRVLTPATFPSPRRFTDRNT